MEEATGVDVSAVRVHVDAEADYLNETLQSRAFTMGSDVFVRPGEYRPGTRAGDELLAHELSHVVQQRCDPAVNSGGSGRGELIQCAPDYRVESRPKYRGKNNATLTPPRQVKVRFDRNRNSRYTNLDWVYPVLDGSQHDPFTRIDTQKMTAPGNAAHTYIQDYLMAGGHTGLGVELPIPSGAGSSTKAKRLKEKDSTIREQGYADVYWTDGSSGYLVDIKPETDKPVDYYAPQLARYIEKANKYVPIGNNGDWNWGPGNLRYDGDIGTGLNVWYPPGDGTGRLYELRLKFRSVEGFILYKWYLQ
jgi:Domain of unknown function (DUF4157)